MQKWEYKIVQVALRFPNDAAETTRKINLFGEEGWELVTGSLDESERYTALIFKRQKSGS